MTQKTFTGAAASSDTFMAIRNGNSVRELFVSRVSKEVKPELCGKQGLHCVEC